MAEATERVSNRRERRQLRNREALILAGYEVIAAKGMDAATMGEIAELADVGSGTVYNYFASKDELVVAVMERVMHRLAERVQAVTDTFDQPAHVYAFGIRSVIRATIEDPRWRGLLNRSEVISDAMFRVMGPFAIRDIRAAQAAGQCSVADAELAWRLATHVLTGFGLGVVRGRIDASAMNEALVMLLGMVGIERAAATAILDRTWPELPPE